MQSLIESGIDVNQESKYGENCLHLLYFCEHRYAYEGEGSKYVIEACLKGSDAAFWSAASCVNLKAKVLPIWENPHREYRDEREEEEMDDPIIPQEALKLDQEFIISDQWNVSYNDDPCNVVYEMMDSPAPPRDFMIQEKPGSEADKIIWCNEHLPDLGHKGSNMTVSLKDTWTGNEAATEDLAFYNFAGVFVEIPSLSERKA